METVNFFDKERVLIMQFKDFQLMKTNTLNIVSFVGNVEFEFFRLETKFEAEIFDFKNFSSSLDKMYNEKLKYISFNPLSGNIFISLSIDKGQIKVVIKIFNDLSTAKLEIEYGIDQSFIPDLINEIEKVIAKTI